MTIRCFKNPIFIKTKTKIMQDNNTEDFKIELGLLDGTMLVMVSMIGLGIFIVRPVILPFFRLVFYNRINQFLN